MKQLTCAGAIFFAVLLLAASPAATPAQSSGEDRRRCYNPNPDIRIAGCTAIIRAPGEIDADRAAAFANRGIAYMDKGDFDRAIHDFDQAIRLSPDDAEAFGYRGIAYDEKGDDKRAVQDFNQAIQLNPNSARFLNSRCWARAILGDLQLALTDCNKSLRLNSNEATFDSRGLVYLKMQNADAAITDYNAVLAVDPKAPSSLYGRGLAEHMKGNESASQADITAAVKLQSDIAAQFAKWGVPAPAAAVVSTTPASK
jgi:tetratricopeptide (TPR) repeat protein